MEFDKNGKLTLKILKKTIKHEEDAFDEDDFFKNEYNIDYEED